VQLQLTFQSLILVHLLRNDGSIRIITSSGLSPFQYSINGGQSFSDNNTFENLSTGNYNVFIRGAYGLCTYEETVFIDACNFTDVEINTTAVSSVVSYKWFN